MDRPAPGDPIGWLGRLIARDRAAAISVAALVLIASLASVPPASGAHPSSDPASFGPRLVVGGGVLNEEAPASTAPTGGVGALGSLVVPSTAGPYLSDGTLLKPIVVDTSVPDSRDRLATYTVKAGDTLYSIAAQHGLSFGTVMWANGLTGTLLHIGQVLVLPPIDGVVVTVAPGDTLDAIAARTGVDATTIADYNQLTEGDLVVGQILIVPGGTGPSIGLAVTGQPAARSSSPTGSAGGCAGCGFAPLEWPVPGGYMSQPFGCTGFIYEPRYGSCPHFHSGIDIAAPEGSRIVAAAAGTVIFAGWKANGGGYQVWVSDGNDLYTGYHHMSSVAVHAGEQVARGQFIGRVGMTGNATGPHCHFMVTIGPIGTTGYPVDPRRYL